MLWNIIDVFIRLKDIIINLNLSCLILKTVFDISFSVMWTCQYLEIRSIFIRYFVLSN